MKNRKIIVVLCYIAAICFYISAIICFVSKTSSSMGVTMLAAGSAWMMCGTINKNKLNEEE